jgi:hypothetical protein
MKPVCRIPARALPVLVFPECFGPVRRIIFGKFTVPIDFTLAI